MSIVTVTYKRVLFFREAIGPTNNKAKSLDGTCNLLTK